MKMAWSVHFSFVADCTKMVSVSYILLLIVLWISAVSSGSTLKDYLQTFCGEHIRLSTFPAHSLKLDLSPYDEYAALTDCYVIVHAEAHQKIFVTFLEMDIRSYGACHNDYLQIFDSGRITNDSFHFGVYPQNWRYCGNDLPEDMTSSYSNLTLRFVSDAAFQGHGFSLLLTAFHEGTCHNGEYKCDNSRCIDNDLYCDDFDNCGDGSDGCQLPLYLFVGIVLTSVLAVIALLVLVAVLRYRCKRKSAGDVPDRQAFSSCNSGYTCNCDPDCLSTVSQSASLVSSSLSRFMPYTLTTSSSFSTPPTQMRF